MSNLVTRRRRAAGDGGWDGDAGSLYGRDGGRKYLNHVERQRALAAMALLELDQALFALTLAWTGARVSEVLEVTPLSFQVDRNIVALRTLKRRRFVVREVPIPPEHMAALESYFNITQAQHDLTRARQRLWPRHRVTGWRIIKNVMMVSQIVGIAACPRGLRHAFGVGTLQADIPINLVQRWLGHARLATTAIYTGACGPEEIAFAERYWRMCQEARPVGIMAGEEALAAIP